MSYFDGLDQKLERIRTEVFYEPYIEELKKAYEEIKKADTILDYQSFMCYYTTGSRKEYEDKYFARRTRLGTALMLYLLYEEEEYMDALCGVIWDICNEVTWVLPAHLADVKVEDYRTHIDLFAAETAHSLAEADYLLGDKLPERIRSMIRHEVTTRTFDAYESRPYFWEKLISNWPGVCGSSVGMAYLYLAPERFENVKERILNVMDTFLKSYGDDGSNTEGMSEEYNSPASPYWAFKWFIILAIDEGHPFWSAMEGEVLPTKRISIQKEKNFLIQNIENGQHAVALCSGQYVPNGFANFTAKYSKFAYSSKYAFSVSRGYWNV